METQQRSACATIDVWGRSLDDLWRAARAVTDAPVTLEMAPYFVDTVDGRWDLEELPTGVRVRYASPKPGLAERQLKRFVRRLRGA